MNRVMRASSVRFLAPLGMTASRGSKIEIVSARAPDLRFVPLR